MDVSKERDLAYLEAVRAGDSQACGMLLDAYRPLTDSMASYVMSRTHADEAEVHSEAEFALYRAAMTFDMAQDTMTFGLYAKICVRNHLITKFLRKKAVPPAVSLDELAQNGEYEALMQEHRDEAADTVVEAESLRALHCKIREVLSTYELSVFHLWLEDYSAREIAARLGRDEKSVTNAISRSLTKLRAALH